VYLLLSALQVEHLVIITSPQFGQRKLTKLSLANICTPHVEHFNAIEPLLDYLTW
jgi:hypothetical protein